MCRCTLTTAIREAILRNLQCGCDWFITCCCVTAGVEIVHTAQFYTDVTLS